MWKWMGLVSEEKHIESLNIEIDNVYYCYIWYDHSEQMFKVW